MVDLLSLKPMQPDALREVANIGAGQDRKSTRLNYIHLVISYAVLC